MTTTEYMVWFGIMAVATTAILVVGTLAAADLLPLPRSRREADRRSPRSHHPRRHQDEQADAAGDRRADALDALSQLGSSLSSGSQLAAPPHHRTE